jgi:HEAT repeat protein
MTPERRKSVLADLNHRSMLTANNASRSISQDPDPALLPGLAENTKVRSFAAETLAHRHRRGSHAVLLRNLQDPSREVRFWCAFALGQMREKKALPALSRLAECDHRILRGWWAVSKEAKDAIAEIEQPPHWGRRDCVFCPHRE